MSTTDTPSLAEALCLVQAVVDRCTACGQQLADPDDDAPAWFLAEPCSQCLVCTDCCDHDEEAEVA